MDVETGIGNTPAGLVQVYPNPFSDYTTVSFTHNPGESHRVIVTDIGGKTVLVKENVCEGSVIIERSNLAAGYYNVEVRGTEVFRGKLVIR